MKERILDRRNFLAKSTLASAGAGVVSSSLSVAQSGSLLAQQGPARVPRKKLGKTGLEVPILGMGGSQKFDPKFDRRLHRAFSIGIDYFDTSERYSNGQSQKTLGTFAQQVGDRKKVWLTSKVSSRTHPAKGDAPPEHFKNNLEKILQDMRTDYLDGFFMHGIDNERFLEPEFIKMSEELKQSGKINFFGFSCHAGNVPELLSKAARVGGIDIIMFRYSFRTYGDAALNRAIDAAKEAGIGLLAMKTMGSYPEEDKKIAAFRSQNFTFPQAKLKAIWADDRIDACVSEMANVQMVMENAAAAMSNQKLAMSEFIQLNRLAAQTAHQHCLGCAHICESKITGDLKVADILRYLMYSDSYGNLEKGRDAYRSLSMLERSFEGVDLGEAQMACPQGIDIAARLAAAHIKLA
jgi:predicted aldo/keto reductase-like oxidoreductase